MPKKAGFSLIELSIVLVIIGLVVGGVMVGAGLIHNTEIKNTVSDITRFKNAAFNFKRQYGDLPGDLMNATQIWGVADAGSCKVTPSLSKATCDGNGDGRIQQQGVASSEEHLRAWQHLANAEMIEGKYTGAYVGGAGGDMVGGTNVPETPVNNGVYEMHHYEFSGIFGRRGHFIKIGRARHNGANNAILSPIDAAGIDKKYDDGSSNSGDIISLDAFDVGGCVTGGGSVSGSSAYILDNSEESCRMYFWID